MEETPVFKFVLREDLKDNLDYLPTRIDKLSTGWDVKAAITDTIVIRQSEFVNIPLGFKVFCPTGYGIEIRPKFKVYDNKHLNSLFGTVHESSDKELVFAAQYIPFSPGWTMDVEDLVINPGDSIAQIVPVKRQEMTIQSISEDEFNLLIETRNSLK